VVIKIFKASLLATTYVNGKALVTNGLTQYTEEAKQTHCQHNIVAVRLCLIFSISAGNPSFVYKFQDHQIRSQHYAESKYATNQDE